MRDPKRIDRIIELLRAYWHTYPDLRFFQMILALEKRLFEEETINLFFLEDEDFEKVMKKNLDKLKNLWYNIFVRLREIETL